MFLWIKREPIRCSQNSFWNMTPCGISESQACLMAVEFLFRGLRDNKLWRKNVESHHLHWHGTCMDMHNISSYLASMWEVSLPSLKKMCGAIGGNVARFQTLSRQWEHWLCSSNDGGLQEALFVTTSDLMLCSFPFLIVLYKTVLYCIRLLYSRHEVGKWEFVVAGHSERSRQRWLVTGSRISGRTSGRYVQITTLIHCNIDIWYIPIYHI